MKKIDVSLPRVDRVREALREQKADALLILNIEGKQGANIRYLSGFTGSASVCLLTHEVKVLMTDPRYALQAPQESPDWDIRIGKYAVSDLVKEFSVSRLGLIAGGVSWERVNQLREKLPKVKLLPLPDIVKEVRSVKDGREVESIRSAVRMMEEVLQELYAMVVPGRTTDCELATALKMKLIERGSDISFPPIIVSGSDSAFIHGDPFKLRKERGGRQKVIEQGDIIQFDVGCLVDGYCSDISRVAVVGRASREQKEIHRTVQGAIEAARAHYRPGARGGESMKAAVEFLKSRGVESGMVHGLGHGIGLEVHELPITHESFTFQAGNVISLEPGIYREGYGGMRIERDVLITEDGHEFLDTLSTDLIEL